MIIHTFTPDGVISKEATIEDYCGDYAMARRREYPPMEDYLDGIVKNDSAQIKKYIDACLAVKAKYPKPEDK